MRDGIAIEFAAIRPNYSTIDGQGPIAIDRLGNVQPPVFEAELSARQASTRRALREACSCSCCGGLMVAREQVAEESGVSLSTLYRFLRGVDVDEPNLEAFESWLRLKRPRACERRRPRAGRAVRAVVR